MKRNLEMSKIIEERSVQRNKEGGEENMWENSAIKMERSYHIFFSGSFDWIYFDWIHVGGIYSFIIYLTNWLK